MPRRVSLPVRRDPSLTLERARQRLGGRAASHGRAGEVVRVGDVVGVILCSDAKGCDVWIGDDKTKRVRAADAEPLGATPNAEIAAVAADALAFARLEEGADVSFDHGATGRLVEKCRFGALVAEPDGRIFAVGFRRIARPKAN